MPKAATVVHHRFVNEDNPMITAKPSAGIGNHKKWNIAAALLLATQDCPPLVVCLTTRHRRRPSR
ncbi:MAG: hypothetical protein R3C61_03525 [Bacteroidia bacterium]